MVNEIGAANDPATPALDSPASDHDAGKIALTVWLMHGLGAIEGKVEGMAQKQARAGRSYHHGDLRRALLEAAEAELAEKGPEGFTLRSCAKRAGVSHAAPAHHFTDMAGLLSALAAEGFERFLAEMSRRVSISEASPQQRLTAAGLGYVAFARANPALFRLMFSSNRPDHGQPPLADAATAAFDHLIATVAAIEGPVPLESAAGRRQAAKVWALAHGIADLLISGRLNFLARQGEEQLQQDLEAIFSGIYRNGG